MCTRYISPEDRELEDFWTISWTKNRRKDSHNLTVFPLSQATFIRAVQEGGYEVHRGVNITQPPLLKRKAALAKILKKPPPSPTDTAAWTS